MEAIDALLEPIEGDHPAGPSVRYEPVYDQIKDAREEEDDTLPQGEWKHELKVADFPLVEKLATGVLQERSKDLQVAAWLTEAWTRLRGMAGLRDGLVLLRRLLEEFWDGVHPEIDEDGDLEFRAVPLEWIGLYLTASVEAIPLTEPGLGLLHHRESRTVPSEEEAESEEAKGKARREALEAGRTTPEDFHDALAGSSKAFYKELAAELDEARTALAELEELCDERFGSVSPNLIPLRELLAEMDQLAGQWLGRKLKEDPDPVEAEPEEVEEEAGSDAGEAGAAGTAPATGSDGGPVAPAKLESASDAAGMVAEAARFLRRARPSDPSPYLLLRGLRWGELRASGEGLDPKLLVAPPTQVRTRLKGFVLDGKWAELLDACEEVMATPHGRGWLDLQRYALEACEGLGTEYDMVAEAVKGALRSLLRDLPDLLEATLMDDSPTANAETRTWLAKAILPSAGEEGEAAPPARGDDSDRALARQVARLKAAQPQQAVQLLMRKASQEKSARARFLRRSQAADIMVQSGLEPVALPILREMVDQIERHNLEEWEEGETVAQPLALLYRCMNKLNGDEHERQELYLRICRLDPMQAMTFDSGGGGEGGA